MASIRDSLEGGPTVAADRPRRFSQCGRVPIKLATRAASWPGLSRPPTACLLQAGDKRGHDRGAAISSERLQRKIQAASRLRQQRLHLDALRRNGAATKPGAFEPRGGGGEPERVLDPAALDQGESECAMKHIARAERVDSLYREYWRFADGCVIAVKPQHRVGAVGDGEKRIAQFAHVDEAGREIVASCSRPQARGGK